MENQRRLGRQGDAETAGDDGGDTGKNPQLVSSSFIQFHPVSVRSGDWMQSVMLGGRGQASSKISSRGRGRVERRWEVRGWVGRRKEGRGNKRMNKHFHSV